MPASLFVKDYYSILQVRRFAGVAEVRRAYRTLVQKYHPDVNPDPSAAIIIREVNEAYEVLGDTQKKMEYDNQLINPYQQQPPVNQQSKHRDPRYRPAQRPAQKDNRQLELIQEYVHLAVKACIAGCLIFGFMLVDYCLPRKVINDSVQSLYTYSAGRVSTHYVVGESGRQIKISLDDMNTLVRNKPIQIIETGITSITLEVYFPEKDYHIRSLATVYRNYAFVPIILLITSVLGLVMKDKVEFRFNLGIVSFFLLIITLVLIVK